MKTALKTVMLVVLAFVVAVPLLCGDASAQKAQKGKKKGKKGGVAQLVNAQTKRLAKAELTDEQTAKIKELAAEYGPKIIAARQKQALTKEQQTAQKEARQKAQADGLKGKALRDAVDKALGLSEEQTAARAEMQKLTQEFAAAVNGLLTDEQKEKAGIKGGKKKAKKKVQAKVEAAN